MSWLNCFFRWHFDSIDFFLFWKYCVVWHESLIAYRVCFARQIVRPELLSYDTCPFFSFFLFFSSLEHPRDWPPEHLAHIHITSGLFYRCNRDIILVLLVKCSTDKAR